MRVVVVGGGIVGASAAYHLSGRGADVVVIDRGDPGGATSAGAGIIFPWLATNAPPDLVELRFRAAAYYPALVADLADLGLHDVGYTGVGGLVVGRDGDAVAGALARLQGARDAGTDAIGALTRLAPGQPAGYFPPLDASLAGVAVSGAGRVDGHRLRQALGNAAAAAGATRIAGPATLDVRDGHVHGVRANDELVTADAVVVAAGAWSAEVCRPLGVDLPVAPQRGQIVHLRVPGLDTDRAPVIEVLGSTHYLLGFPGSHVVVGATRETGAGFDHRVTVAGLAEVLGRALESAPGLADATVVETRVGFRPATPDGSPLLGALDGFDNVVVATGLGPYGLTVGPLAGAIVADLLAGGSSPLDLAGFRPQRMGRR